jgi:hypothetical protein
MNLNLGLNYKYENGSILKLMHWATRVIIFIEPQFI